MMEIAL